MRKYLPALFFASILLFTGQGCFNAKQPQLTPVTLQYWRTADTADTMAVTIADYKKIHPNVDITYVEMPEENYEEKLLEAFAENRGPDLFSIPNVAIRDWKAKLAPLPDQLTVVTQEVNDKQQVVTAQKTTPSITVREVINEYVETAVQDIVLKSIPEKSGDVSKDVIYGLPYSMDTLALFANNDLLKKAQIDKPAENWQAFNEQAGKLTVLDSQQNILQSGAGIGTAGNVLYAPELLAAIMMQNGAPMSDENGFATFDRNSLTNQQRAYLPGAEALIFYQSFQSIGQPNYTWNAGMPLSLDAFVTGKTAYFFGFPTDVAEVRTRAAKLDFSVTKLPQVNPARPANIAIFPVEVVSKRTQHPNEAWDFIQFAAKADHVTSFLSKAKRPTALRALIGTQLTDPDLAAFAGQVLTAQSWYKGVDYAKTRGIFSQMISTIPPPDRPEYQRIVNDAVSQVNQTIIKRQ